MLPPTFNPASPAPTLYGIDGQVRWPAVVARSAVRALLLWPVVYFLGGLRGGRALVTCVAGGAVYTAVDVAWDGASLFATRLAAGASPQVGGGLDDGLSSAGYTQPIIDIPYTPS